MRSWIRSGGAGSTLLGAALMAGACGGSEAAPAPESAGSEGGRINAMIPLMEAGQPVFGLYAPSARARGPEAATTPEKTPAELVAETLGFEASDYIFDGTMEGGFDRALPAFTAYAQALRDAGVTPRTLPVVVKMDVIREDPEAAVRNIGRQLNLGVSAIMFVEVESAEELRTGIDAMRFAANGGTRAEDVGDAASYWGVPEAEYRQKADLWPLNPEGELVNWTIIETLEGLQNVREIAAVPGIGVLWPGAGSLRGVFSTTGPDGQRVVDMEAWEAAIQSVLAACKEFNVACGYPANASDIEMRMEQGFSVFVMGWGEGGFQAIQTGRQAAGR